MTAEFKVIVLILVIVILNVIAGLYMRKSAEPPPVLQQETLRNPYLTDGTYFPSADRLNIKFSEILNANKKEK
jgi:hypothetical protein